MTPRPQSPYRSISDRGRERGIRVTDLDIDRIGQIIRWHCLSPHHLARHETELTDWHPDFTGYTDGRTAGRYQSVLIGIKERLAKLARIAENPPAGIGPLAKSVIVANGQTGWHATRYAATATGAPWNVHPSINPHNALHAWLAADIGMQIERLHPSLRVLSQREIDTRIDRRGDPIDTPLTSTFTTKKHRKEDKRPDVAVIYPNGRDYIAIEAERQTSRRLDIYESKLQAYALNPNVKAVWYVCPDQRTVRRVLTALRNTFDTPPTTPAIRLIGTRDINGFNEIPGLRTDTRGRGRRGDYPLLDDLEDVLGITESAGTR